MRINRLFEIVYLLLARETVTARELAERFEVSQRTIYRDVEILSSANVPIYMRQGKGGGIGLLPGFVLNKTVLSEEEKSEILSALHSLSAADPDSGATLSKLSSLFGSPAADSWVEIDYSDWSPYKREQFDRLKQAILRRNAIVFDYVNTNGEHSRREAEPLTLWFKARAWYLKAFCVNKQDFRLFKLGRMRNIAVTDRRFAVKPMAYAYESVPPSMEMTKVTLRIHSAQNYRVFDDFEDNDLIKNPDGSVTATFFTPVDEWFYGYMLSYGHAAEVLQPEDVRNKMRELLKKSLDQYL